MPEIKRILCPVDFSEFSARAYHLARSLAEHYQAKSFVQHVVELWQYPSADFAISAASYDEFCRVLCARGEEQLHQFLESNSDHKIHLEPLVQQGMAPDAILSFAETQSADLIVMGTHGRRGIDRLMLGSVTERVMRKASCPVLAVHRSSEDFLSPDTQCDPVHLSRFLFCTDFSENSHKALDYAISLTREYDAELTLLHVLASAPDSANLGSTVRATEQLDRLIPQAARATGKVKAAVCGGKPYEQIIWTARELQTDIIIMAARGSCTLDLAVFGSTTYRVLQLGPCPVLVVHA